MGKGRLKLAEHSVWRGVAETFSQLAPCLNLQQVASQFLDGRPGFQLGFFPGTASHLIQSRLTAISQIFLHLFNPLNRQIQTIVAGIFKVQKVTGNISGLQMHKT